MADLHASRLVPLSLIRQGIRLAIEQRPEPICVTGDFITHTVNFDVDRYVGLLRQLSEAAPTYAVLGNHDGGKWAPTQGGYPDHRAVEAILARSGVNLLHNRSHTLRLKGRELSLVGVGDLWSDEIDDARAFAEADPACPTVLLSHNPDSKAMLGHRPWQLMLSGHTHGGQVLVPFAGPVFAPVWDKAYVAGLNPWRGRQIFTTRGVGSVGSIRFRCRPEVSLLTLS